jgi:acyl-coenzyme A thioesterase PaaI-like protein
LPFNPVVDGHGADARHLPGPEHRRLADALRRVTNQAVLTAATPAAIADAAAMVEAAADLLAPSTPEWELALPDFLPGDDPHEYFPFSPQIGLYTPIAPPLAVRVVDGVVHATGNLDAAYEGPPGCVHGGMIASLFDEILGIANIHAGVGAMTGTLTIRYRSPTPLKTDLTLTARHDGIEGRKVYASGEIHAGERLTAECEGIFVIVDALKFGEQSGRS